MSEATKALDKPEIGNLPDPPTDPNDAGALIRHALDQGVAVEVLERLMDLHERVEARNARAAYFEALAACQEEIPEIPKTGQADIRTSSGTKFGYKFAPLEAITRTIRPVLRKHGLSYSWTTEPSEKGVLSVICILRHVDGHEERSAFPVPTATSAAMSEAQKNGAALTYGRRQSLVAVLGLTASEDSDGGDPGGGEPVTDEQLADLEAKMSEVGINRPKFLKFLGVDKLGDLDQPGLAKALKACEDKRRRNQ